MTLKPGSGSLRVIGIAYDFLLTVHSNQEKKKKKNLFFAQKPNIKMNKHVNKVRKATGRVEAITAGRQRNKQQYLIIQLMKRKKA